MKHFSLLCVLSEIIVTLQMLKNENERDNLFILTNVINVSEPAVLKLSSLIT